MKVTVRGLCATALIFIAACSSEPDALSFEVVGGRIVPRAASPGEGGALSVQEQAAPIPDETGCGGPRGLARRPYVFETLTASTPYQQRDGARLHYLPSTGRYWLLGGWWPFENASWGNDRTTNEVWSTRDLLDWRLELRHDAEPPVTGPGARWGRRHVFPTVVHQGQLWVLGGEANFSPWPSDVWKSPDGVNWERVLAAAPWTPKYEPISATYNGAMYLMGGFDYHTLSASSEMWRSFDGVRWERLADMPFARAGVYAGAVLCGRLFVIGGSSGPQAARTLHNDTWSWDGRRWTHASASAGWVARDFNATATYGGRLWVINGASPGNTRDVWFSEDLGATWHELEGSPWSPSHADAVVSTQAGIVLASGSQLFNSVYRVTAVTDPPTAAPASQ